MDVTFISYFVTPDQITHQSIDPRDLRLMTCSANVTRKSRLFGTLNNALDDRI